MWKTFFTGLLLLGANICFSQIKNSKLIWEKYSETKNRNSNFYLIELDSAAPAKMNARVNVEALRKLNQKLFIIDKELLEDSMVSKLFIKKIVPANNEWKLSPMAESLFAAKQKLKTNYAFTLQTTNNFSLQKLLQNHPELKSKIKILADQNIISLSASSDEIKKIFLDDKSIIFIDVIPSKPLTELGVPGFDLSANQINLVHKYYPTIDGSGQHVSIKEEDFDTTDIDMKGRYDASPLASKNITNHANFMATIIAGGGNSVWYAKGAAWAANISSSSFDPILPDGTSYYLNQNITVQNHSYGTLIDNNYGLNAVAFDKSANDDPDLIHVFSSGNSGRDTAKTSAYAGIPDFANITGNFKMAKNIIVVGGVDSLGNVVIQSSRGPAYDGRIKPDIVAFQMNGTSESAALVSGTASLLQQYYKSLHSDSLLPSALLKAILINTADDVNKQGPDYATGFGNLNAFKAMNLVKNNTIFSGLISQNQMQSFLITIPSNVRQLRVSLVWNDPAATPLSPLALVNDLDLTLFSEATEQTWRPWVLSSFANADSLNLIAKRKRDSLNNEEQVTIENPVAGNYRIQIKGFDLLKSPQSYFVVYDFDTSNYFHWQRPVNLDLIKGGSENILRWESSFTNTGNLEYSFAPFTNWQQVENVNLAKKYVYWQTPDTIAQALLRMKANNRYFYSDTFSITRLVNPKAGFICGDSLLIYWNKIKGIGQYEIYGLGKKYLQSILKVNDTVAIFSKHLVPNKFISVAPVFPSGITGVKSYAFNYELQGAACYINSFLAQATDTKASLTLNLGTVYNIDSISFEKQNGKGFTSLFTTKENGSNEYDYEDPSLKRGITFFRARIKLKNGQTLFSEIQSVFYVEPGKYLLLPNPVKRNGDINLYTAIPDDEIISVYDAMGRKILNHKIQSAHEVLKSSGMQSGLYFYQIFKKGQPVDSGKLIIVN